MFKKNYFKVLLLTLVMALVFTGCSGDKGEESNTESEKKVQLTVYAGAGLKRAMDKIKPVFEAMENVEINYIYAGSGQLISQIETSGKGDVFIVGSEATYDIAKEQGNANESTLIAHHTPGLAVQKGNPKNIKSLKDLIGADLKVALGDKDANAVGKTAMKIIEKNGLEKIHDNVIVTTATVNELIVAIAAGEADVAIVTEDSIRFSDEVELIEIPEEENIDQFIPAGTLTMSKHPELAQKLVDFIASEEGKAIFEEAGYKILK